jgi:hypothetical protein
MSDQSHDVTSEPAEEVSAEEVSAEEVSAEEVSADAGAPPAPRPGRSRWSRWVAVIGPAIAVIAIAVAAWLVLHPPKASSPAAVTDQQIADAKARACIAFNTVRSAVSLQTHADPGGDPAAVQAVAANARLSMAAGGAYLLARLDPSTPPPLAAAIRTFADDLQDIAMNTLAGVSNDDPAQAARLHDGETQSARIANLCQ